MISSADNAQLKHLRKLLTQAKARRAHGQAVLEGVHLLCAALDAGYAPEKVFIPEARFADAEIQACVRRLGMNQIEIIADKVAASISTLTHGAEVLSLMATPAAVDKVSAQDCVVLAGVQDPGNVGTILRSAAASGVRYIVTDKQCADVFSPKVLRSAMGAHFVLNIVEGIDVVAFLKGFSGKRYITTLEHTAVKDLYALDLRTPGAWVFGNEGAGVSAEVAACADYGVRIPMAAGVESLNVAMAASVCLFEQMRQRRAG